MQAAADAILEADRASADGVCMCVCVCVCLYVRACVRNYVFLAMYTVVCIQVLPCPYFQTLGSGFYDGF
jgi:hypothetical protein